MNKVVLILPYFGKLPNYFDLFLYSCSKNINIDFHIYTDQDINCKYNNVKYTKMSFEELNELSFDKLGVKISSPYKLCDFKPTYGKLFENFIDNYEFWGYCDCDLLFGNLDILLKEELLNKYDKILSDGHLTIYRNNDKINNLYTKELKEIINFKDIVQINEPCFFDEIMFPIICKKNEIKTYINKVIYADILPKYFDLKMPQNNLKNQIFMYDDGKLTRLEDDKEYIYIHLQKRKMVIDKNFNFNQKIYIYPNIFANKVNHTKTLRIKYSLKYYINYFKRLNINRIKIKLITRRIKKNEKL